MLNTLRKKILLHDSSLNTFGEAYKKIYRKRILAYFQNKVTPQKVFDLGDTLSDIFFLPSGRSQRSLTTSGTAWECLLVWYLNLILWDTNLVASRRSKKFVPAVINDALTVAIGQNHANTESDIVIFSSPPENDLKRINLEIKKNISSQYLEVMQAKTNWNDSAQIPMLWNILYHSQKNPMSNLTVGINGFGPDLFDEFRYSFVTVPTTPIPKSNSLPVVRVSNLSGGNYWGKKSQTGIAISIKEIFMKNHKKYFSKPILDHINDNLSKPNWIENYIDLNFPASS